MVDRTVSIGTLEDAVQYDDASEFAMIIDNAANQEILVSDGNGQFTAGPVGSGGAAPIGASYIVIALDGDLTSERRLQGTANEIALTDGGAGGDVTLGFPSSVIINTLGIGVSPTAPLDVFSSVAGPHLIVRTDDGNAPTLQLGLAVPPNINAAGKIDFRFDRAVGGGGSVARLTWLNGPSQTTPAAQINVLIGSTDTKADMTLSTSNAERIRIKEDGDVIIDTDTFVVDASANRVGVGITVPLAKAHIDQSSLTAAIPVLFLDQADLSEKMIEFNTTIGVGNPIEAIGAKTFTETHFIKITIPGGLSRVIPCGTIA